MDVFWSFCTVMDLNLGFGCYVLISMSSWNCQTKWMSDARHNFGPMIPGRGTTGNRIMNQRCYLMQSDFRALTRKPTPSHLSSPLIPPIMIRPASLVSLLSPPRRLCVPLSTRSRHVAPPSSPSPRCTPQSSSSPPIIPIPIQIRVLRTRTGRTSSPTRRR